MAHPGGRPTKFVPEQLEPLIEEYFNTTQFEKWTITGLILHCNASKDLFLDYEKRPEFSALIKGAKLRVESSYEASLREGGNAAGTIFALKQFKWTDKTEVTQTIEMGPETTKTMMQINKLKEKMKQYEDNE